LQAAPNQWQHRNVLVRSSLVADLSGQESALPMKIVLPDGQEASVRLETRSGDFVARFERPKIAGHYGLKIGESRRWFGVNLPPEESDLEAIDAETLRQRLGVPFEYVTSVEGLTAAPLATPAREMSLMVLWVVLALVLLETLLAQRFGHVSGTGGKGSRDQGSKG